MLQQIDVHVPDDFRHSFFSYFSMFGYFFFLEKDSRFVLSCSLFNAFLVVTGHKRAKLASLEAETSVFNVVQRARANEWKENAQEIANYAYRPDEHEERKCFAMIPKMSYN